jgi:hypothetical protein
VVVDRNGELLLRQLLADHVLVEELLDFGWRRQRRAGAAAVKAVVVRDDVVADFDTLIADEDSWTRDQFADVVLIFIAERAAKNLAAVPAFFDHVAVYLGYTRFRMTSSIIPYSLP